MDHRITLSPLWDAARDDLRSRRAARASRRTLESELAGYTTAAEQNELEAILQRADPDAAAQIRSIIGHSRVA
jgi:hypothetical protein